MGNIQNVGVAIAVGIALDHNQNLGDTLRSGEGVGAVAIGLGIDHSVLAVLSIPVADLAGSGMGHSNYITADSIKDGALFDDGNGISAADTFAVFIC